MNGCERIKVALVGKETDKIPVMLHNFMMIVKEAGLSMGQYRENPKTDGSNRLQYGFKWR